MVCFLPGRAAIDDRCRFWVYAIRWDKLAEFPNDCYVFGSSLYVGRVWVILTGQGSTANRAIIVNKAWCSLSILLLQDPKLSNNTR